jgi:hypothetical protein
MADRLAETEPYKDLLDNYGMFVQDIAMAAVRAVVAKNL